MEGAASNPIDLAAPAPAPAPTPDAGALLERTDSCDSNPGARQALTRSGSLPGSGSSAAGARHECPLCLDPLCNGCAHQRAHVRSFLDSLRCRGRVLRPTVGRGRPVSVLVSQESRCCRHYFHSACAEALHRSVLPAALAILVVLGLAS